ncbi:MAG: ribose 5-phosphate isomerase A [Candidatus Micrarchaeia archaeon]
MLQKINAAKKALEMMEENKIIGLGSGTTAAEFVRMLGEKKKAGFKIDACIPTSFEARMFAIKYGLSRYLCDPDQVDRIHVAVDGADYVSKEFIIKGGGAALTREKVVAYNAERFIVIADESKIAKGPKSSVALEAIKFSAPFVIKTLAKLGYPATIRVGTGKVGPIISDNNNFIIDAKIEIKNPSTLESMLNSIPGVLENGIFTKFTKIIIGTEKGAYEL